MLRASRSRSRIAAERAHFPHSEDEPSEPRLPVPVGVCLVVAQRFSVQFDRRTVGIAVRVPGGFMFYASDDEFEDMEGHVFPRARAIERALKKTKKRKDRVHRVLTRPSFA